MLQAQGELTGAQGLYEEALALRQRVLPSEHPAIAQSLNNLAGVLRAQGELTKAGNSTRKRWRCDSGCCHRSIRRLRRA
ncbi:MAG: tetratricopeptide repeat protein [Thermomicrobiales bacterium]